MKKLGLLFALFAGLGLFVYFYEIKGEEERSAAKELEESVLKIEEDEIVSVRLEEPGEDPIQLKREGEDWLLVEPIESAADQFAVDALLRDLSGAEKDRTLSLEEAGGLEPFGLDEPRLRLQLKTPEQEKTLYVGGEDYTGTKIYLRLEGADEIHLSPKAILTSADKKLFDWRSKSLLDFEQDKVQAVELSRPAGKVRLEKVDGDWRLVEPIQEKADSSAVSSLLSGIKFARIQKFLSETSDDLTTHGLDQPRLVLRLREEGQDRWKSLELGEKKDDQYPARHPDRPAVFTVQESVAEKISQDVWEFRDKDIVGVDQDQVNRFALTTPEGVLAIRRSGEEWIVESPEEQRGKTVATWRFWSPLSGIGFESISDQPSQEGDPRFASSEFTLELTLKDESSLFFDFAKSGDSYLARQRAGGRNGTIAESDFEKLQLKAEEIVDE